MRGGGLARRCTSVSMDLNMSPKALLPTPLPENGLATSPPVTIQEQGGYDSEPAHHHASGNDRQNLLGFWCGGRDQRARNHNKKRKDRHVQERKYRWKWWRERTQSQAKRFIEFFITMIREHKNTKKNYFCPWVKRRKPGIFVFSL